MEICLAFAFATPVAALTLSPGQIIGIELSGLAGGFNYSTVSESFTVDMDVNKIVTTGGETSGFAAGEITFHMELALVPGTLTVTGPTTLQGSYAASSVPGFAITDNVGLADLLRADFSVAPLFQMSIAGFGTQGSVLGNYDVRPDSSLVALLPATGTLSVNFANPQFTPFVIPNFACDVLDIALPCNFGGPVTAGGLKGFSAQPTAADPGFPAIVPEPSAAALLILGTLALVRRRRCAAPVVGSRA